MVELSERHALRVDELLRRVGADAVRHEQPAIRLPRRAEEVERAQQRRARLSVVV